MELIDREALKESFNIEELYWGRRINDIIDNAPTVRPSFVLKDMTEEDIENFKVAYQRATSKGLIIKTDRPHGKWLGWINEIWGGTTIYCSNCKIDALRDKNNHFVKSNFCPNCGADMREANDET